MFTFEHRVLLMLQTGSKEQRPRSPLFLYDDIFVHVVLEVFGLVYVPMPPVLYAVFKLSELGKAFRILIPGFSNVTLVILVQLLKS